MDRAVDEQILDCSGMNEISLKSPSLCKCTIHRMKSTNTDFNSNLNQTEKNTNTEEPTNSKNYLLPELNHLPPIELYPINELEKYDDNSLRVPNLESNLSLVCPLSPNSILTIISKSSNPPPSPPPTTSSFNRKLKLALLLLSLSLTILLSFLDSLILTTTLTKLMIEFKTTTIQLLTTSYVVSSISVGTIYPKLSDIFGRKPVLTISLLLFTVGSLLCGLSSSLNMLIVSRFVAGLGGGGLITLSVIILSDLVPIQNRGIVMSLTGIMFAISCCLGPLVGGMVADKLNWRWCFFINLPICLLALICFWFIDLNQINLNRNDEHDVSDEVDEKGEELTLLHKFKSIDWLGSLTFIVFVSSLLVSLHLITVRFAHNYLVYILLTVALLSLCGFIYVECKVTSHALLPIRLLTNLQIILTNLSLFLTTVVYFYFIYYAPIYLQLVNNLDVTMTALYLLPFMLVTVLGSILSGVYTSKFRLCKLPLIVGTSLMLVATVLLGLRLHSNIAIVELVLYSLTLCFGFGNILQTSTIQCQGSTKTEDLAVVTGLCNFTQAFASIVSLAAIDSLFNVKLRAHDLNGIHTGIGVDNLVNTFRFGFIVLIPVAALACIPIWFLKNRKLGEDNEKVVVVDEKINVV